MRACFLAVAIALVVGTFARPAAAVETPPGYELTSRTELRPGLTHSVLTSTDPHQVVHVARMRAGGELTLRTVVSNDDVQRGLERTSAMCRRVNCIAAVNGDFAFPGGAPVGGVVSLGELVRSPSGAHHQFVVSPDGGLHAGGLEWSGALVSTDLRRLDIGAVNVPRENDSLVLYTPGAGPTTGTNPHGVEIAATVTNPTGGRIPLGHTAVARLEQIHDGAGSTPIPRDGLVLSGHGVGADALRDLWSRVESGAASADVLIRTESTPHAAESVGGSPILVREGARWFTDHATAFVRGRHPRTLAGRTSGGDVLLVTVDGRQQGYSVGMSLAEAADLMIGLGAVDAINLDGGGSTTFVVDGAVVNRPSDRAVRRGGDTRIVHTVDDEKVLGNVERPVTVALAIVARTVGRIDASGPAPIANLDLPQALPAVPLQADDPASDPTAALPVMLPEVPDGERGPAPLAALTAFVAALSLALWRRPLHMVVAAPQGLRSLTTSLTTALTADVFGPADAPLPIIPTVSDTSSAEGADTSSGSMTTASEANGT